MARISKSMPISPLLILPSKAIWHFKRLHAELLPRKRAWLLESSTGGEKATHVMCTYACNVVYRRPFFSGREPGVDDQAELDGHAHQRDVAAGRGHALPFTK